MKRVVSYKVSDISGVELTPLMSKTIRFTFDGVAYSIDLTNEEALEFEIGMNPWIQAATRIGGRQPARGRRSLGRSSQRVRGETTVRIDS